MAQELRTVLEPDLRAGRDLLTFVPMPPSLTKAHPMHDDRVLQIIHIMTRGLGSDVRELVIQTRDMPAAHEVPKGTWRPRPDDWYNVYAVNDALANPVPQNIVVIDDVLTAGSHFVGIKRRLRERFPTTGKIIGCLYARRVEHTRSEDE